MTKKVKEADWALTVAADAARDLFKCQRPEVVIERLVLTTQDGHDMGGWCIGAVRDVIAKHIREGFTMDVPPMLMADYAHVTYLQPGYTRHVPKRPTITISVGGCARCGCDHEDLVFEKFDRGVEQFQYWAMCPASMQPILLTLTTQNG